MDRTDRDPATLGGLLARLVLFGLLTAVVTLAAGFLLPAGGVVEASATLAFAGVFSGWVLLRRDGWPPDALGLAADRRAAAEVGWGLAAGVVVAGAAMGLMAAAGGLVWRADGSAWSWAGWGAEGVRSLVWLAMPAAAEEILLRGYVLAASARVVGPGWALMVTSLVFGVLHAGNPGAGGLGLVGVTVAGLFLGALVVRTGSLWPAIGAHLGWNWALAFLGDVPVSGLEVADAPGFDGMAAGPDWLSGGMFGVEASVLAIFALGGAAWAAWPRRPMAPVAGRSAPLWADATT